MFKNIKYKNSYQYGWGLFWCLNLQEWMVVWISWFASFAEVKVLAYWTLVSISNYWEHVTTVTSYFGVDNSGLEWWGFWFFNYHLFLFWLDLKWWFHLLNYLRDHRVNSLSYHFLELLFSVHSWLSLKGSCLFCCLLDISI